MTDVKIEVNETKKGKQVAVPGNSMAIILPLEKDPTPSKSGKNLTIASTRGNLRTGDKFDGREITIGVNAYIPAN